MGKKKLKSRVDIPIMIGNKPYRIQTDNYQYIVYEESTRTNKEGVEEKVLTNASYCGTVPSLVRFLCEKKLRDSDAITLQDLKLNMEKILTEVGVLFRESKIV